MQEEAIKANYEKDLFFLKACVDQHSLLLIAASPHNSFKQGPVLNITSLKIPASYSKILASKLSFTYVHAHGIHCIGCIYQEQDHARRIEFYHAIQSVLNDWQILFRK
jgi:hypothetical protein